jgi:hypothetical protein
VILRAWRCPGAGNLYPASSLRGDFARFQFLLGITDGEGVFTPEKL